MRPIRTAAYRTITIPDGHLVCCIDFASALDAVSMYIRNACIQFIDLSLRKRCGSVFTVTRQLHC
jgi:hypothetical protein